MKTRLALAFAAGFAAGAVGSARAQNTVNVDQLFKPVHIGAVPHKSIRVPNRSQVELQSRNFTIAGPSIFAPMADRLGDFLSWADKLGQTAKSSGGISLSDGSIMRLDGNDLMITPPKGTVLRRNKLDYGYVNEPSMRDNQSRLEGFAFRRKF